MANTFTVTERLYLTADDKVVREGDPKAAFLYATPGKEVPMADAVRYGLVKKTEAKQSEPPANKAKTAPANKAGKKRG